MFDFISTCLSTILSYFLLIYLEIPRTKPCDDSCHRVDSFVLVLHPVNHLRRTDFGFNIKSYLLWALTFVKSPAPQSRKKQAIHLLAGGGSGRLQKGRTFPEAVAACFCAVDVALATARTSWTPSTSAYSGVTYHIPHVPLTDHSIVYLVYSTHHSVSRCIRKLFFVELIARRNFLLDIHPVVPDGCTLLAK